MPCCPNPCSWGWYGVRDHAAPVLRRIVNERPILIFVLVIELANRLLSDCARNSYDRAADNLAGPN